MIRQMQRFVGLAVLLILLVAKSAVSQQPAAWYPVRPASAEVNLSDGPSAGRAAPREPTRLVLPVDQSPTRALPSSATNRATARPTRPANPTTSWDSPAAAVAPAQLTAPVATEIGSYDNPLRGSGSPLRPEAAVPSVPTTPTSPPAAPTWAVPNQAVVAPAVPDPWSRPATEIPQTESPEPSLDVAQPEPRAIDEPPAELPGVSPPDEGSVTPVESLPVTLSAPSPVAPASNEAVVETPAAPVSAGAEVTKERIAEVSAQVAEAEGLDETQRAELVELLDQATKWLANAQEYESKTAQYLTEIEEIPQHVAEATDALGQSLPDPRPSVTADVTLSQLEQTLGQAEEQWQAAKTELEQLAEQLDSKTRADRLAEFGQLKDDLKKRIQEAADQLKSLAAAEGAEQKAVVRRIELKARMRAAEQQLKLVDADRQRLEALAELLPLKRDLAQRRCKWSEKHVAALGEVVAEFRKRESERQAAEARRIASQAHPALRDLAESNARLTEQRTQLAEDMETVSGYKEQVAKTLTELREEVKDVTKKVGVHGMTPTVGLLLQNRRDRLPDVGLHRQRIKFARQKMQQAQVASLELEEDRSQLADVDERIAVAIAEIGDGGKQFSPGYLEEMVRDLMEDRRTYLNSLIGDYQTYQGDLNDLELDTRALLDEVDQYRAFIDEHVLWTPSTHVLSARDVRDSGKALASFANAGTWTDVGLSLKQNVLKHPVHSALLVVCCIILFVFRNRMLARLETLGQRVADERELSIVPTLQALVLTVLLSSLGPLMLFGAGWWLSLNADAPDLARGLSHGFKAISLSYFLAEIFRQICRPHGLADKHFGWPPQCLPVLFRSLNWLMLLALPMLFIVSLFAMHDEGAWKDSLGRLAFLMGLAILTLYLHYVLRPKAGVLQAALARAPVGAVQRLRWVWYALGVGFPVALAVLIVLGYSYSVDQLMGRVGIMVCLLLAILLAQAVVRRALSVAWKRLSLLRAAGAIAGVGQPGDETADDEEDHRARHEAVDRQLGQFVGWVAVLAFGVCAWFVWADVFPALQVLDRVEFWSADVVVKQEVQLADGTTEIVREAKTMPITLTHLIIAIVALIASVAAARTLPGLLEFALLARLPIDKGARNACVIISRYLVTLIGFIVACRTIGMTWSSVQWLAAAMTVGLGFGLQEIFANLVSGLIILFERPIRIGDLVTVNGTTGKVTRMQIRATTITDFDRRELVVPNKRFITDDVVNWTLSDPITRFVIPVGISYDNDPAQARDLLLEVARRHPLVLSEPAPSAIFLAFGDSTLNLELRAFLGSRDHYGTVLHELNVAIARAFKEADIEIAFPQQDLHIRSVDGLNLPATASPEPIKKAA